jgi:hypothetical protein
VVPAGGGQTKAPFGLVLRHDEIGALPGERRFTASKLAICRKSSPEAISSLATKERLLHEVGRLLEVRRAS